MLWDCGALLVAAGRKRFWYDELTTFHIAGLQSFGDVWSALKEGLDGMPAGFYGMMWLVRMVPGDPHIILRLPSLAGYLLALLAVWFFLRYRLPAEAAICGLFVLSLSPFRTYSLEARPYALMVGLVAAAAVCWQRIGARRWATPLLGLSLALAVSAHYFAILSIGAFVAAEAIVWLRTRVLRPGVWIACAAGLIPFLLALPVLVSFRGAYGKTFWARPTWLTPFQTYGSYLDMDLKPSLVLIIFLGLTALVALSAKRRGSPGADDKSILPPEEIALILALLVYPAFLAMLTKIAGSGYVPRYGLPGVIGVAAGLVVAVRANWPASGCLAAAMLAAFFYQAGGDIRNLPSEKATSADRRWTRLEAQCRSMPDAPVVIGSGLSFPEAVEYSTPALGKRLLEVVDPAEAVRILDTDTVDQANIRYARYFQLRVVSRDLFESSPRTFFLYSGGGYDWFTRYATEKGYDLKLLWSDAANALYLVTP